MTPEEIKSMQAYAAAAFGQPEVSEQSAQPQVGDSVIIRTGAVVNSFGVRVAQEAGTPCTIVEYEADDDGEDAVWNLPYCVEASNGDTEWLRASEFDVVAVEQSEAAMNDAIDALRVTVNEAEAEIDMANRLHESVVNMYEARLADYARECEALQAEVNRLQKLNAEYGKMIDSANEWNDRRVRRITKLEKRLTPFAKAALDVDVRSVLDGHMLEIHTQTMGRTRIAISSSIEMPEFLRVEHLREALEVLPEVNAGSANAADESQ